MRIQSPTRRFCVSVLCTLQKFQPLQLQLKSYVYCYCCRFRNSFAYYGLFCDDVEDDTYAGDSLLPHQLFIRNITSICEHVSFYFIDLVTFFYHSSLITITLFFPTLYRHYRFTWLVAATRRHQLTRVTRNSLKGTVIVIYTKV